MAKKQNEVPESNELSSRFKRIDAVFAKLRKDKSIDRSSPESWESIPRWKTPSPGLNFVLGGGVPKGKILEMFGQESGGKTAINTLIAGSIVKAGGIVAWVDMECSFDKSYAAKLGLDADSPNFIFIAPTVLDDGSLSITGEDVFTIIESLAAEKVVDYIVVDSVANMTPRKELEGDMGESNMGVMARMMNQGLRKVTGLLFGAKSSVSFINQIRMKLGVMFGDPTTTPGGNGLKFYSSIRLNISRAGKVGPDDSPTGILTKIKCVKNKTAPPFRTATLSLDFSTGFDYIREYVQFGKKYGLVTGSTWVEYQGVKAQGEVKLADALKLPENKPILDDLIQAVEKFIDGDFSLNDVEEETSGDDYATLSEDTEE